MMNTTKIHFLLAIALSACNSNDSNNSRLPVIDENKISRLEQNAANDSGPLTTTTTAAGPIDTAMQIKETLELVSGFEKAAVSFRKDSFSIDQGSSEGGQIFAVHSSNNHILKLYGTIYNEMGKRSFTFYNTHKKEDKFVCVIFTDVLYDRPMYLADMQIKETIKHYQIYNNNKLIAVLNGQQKKQQLTSSKLQDTEKETRLFYNQYLAGIKISK